MTDQGLVSTDTGSLLRGRTTVPCLDTPPYAARFIEGFPNGATRHERMFGLWPGKTQTVRPECLRSGCIEGGQSRAWRDRVACLGTATHAAHGAQLSAMNAGDGPASIQRRMQNRLCRVCRLAPPGINGCSGFCPRQQFKSAVLRARRSVLQIQGTVRAGRCPPLGVGGKAQAACSDGEGGRDGDGRCGNLFHSGFSSRGHARLGSKACACTASPG